MALFSFYQVKKDCVYFVQAPKGTKGGKGTRFMLTKLKAAHKRWLEYFLFVRDTGMYVPVQFISGPITIKLSKAMRGFQKECESKRMFDEDNERDPRLLQNPMGILSVSGVLLCICLIYFFFFV